MKWLISIIIILQLLNTIATGEPYLQSGVKGEVKLFGNNKQMSDKLGDQAKSLYDNKTNKTLSLYKHYYKNDYKVLVTSPGFWIFPSTELASTRFSVSSPEGYPSSASMIQQTAGSSQNSNKSNPFKASLQINRELDLNRFKSDTREVEDAATSDWAAQEKYYGLYYYLVEQDTSCKPTALSSNIYLSIQNSSTHYETVDVEASGVYPEGIHLLNPNAQTGNDLYFYEIDISGNDFDVEWSRHTPKVTLHDIYKGAYAQISEHASYAGNEDFLEDVSEDIHACDTFNEEVGTLTERALTDTETVELEDGVSVENQIYAKGRPEYITFSFKTPAPLDWENVGLSLSIHFGAIICFNCDENNDYEQFQSLNKEFSREDFILMSNTSGLEHKLRLNLMTKLDEMSYEIFILLYKKFSEIGGSSSMFTIKLHNVDSIETYDNDGNMIFDTLNREAMYTWEFKYSGEVAMLPMGE